MSYGGLKDRHAWTWQFLSIFRGPQRNLTHERIAVTYLGQIAEPFTSQNIVANRFRLTLRALQPAEIEAGQEPLEEVRRQGVPNYFDDQRFGSVGAQREFVAKAIENNVLTLRGERRFEKKEETDNYHRVERAYGAFSRSFTLPQTVSSENATAEYKNGVLRVVLHKREEVKARRIEIAGAGAETSTPKTIEAKAESSKGESKKAAGR